MAAIRAQGGVLLCGKMAPIWAVVLVEFCLAYLLECVMGSPLSFRLACRVFAPGQTHPVLFETAVICATVGLMCPAMSFLAAFLYWRKTPGRGISMKSTASPAPARSWKAISPEKPSGKCGMCFKNRFDKRAKV